MVRFQPGATANRYVIASLQMMWSALFIHLTGGRVESHFHIFGSLAFLAFYRDWKVLLPAVVTIAADHVMRGLLWSESVYGIANPEWWRFLEHAFWVVFESVILTLGIVESLKEMKALAERQAALEELNEHVEGKVTERTTELAEANVVLRREIEQRERIEAELRAAQKLEVVGRLATGLAEDIDGPVQSATERVAFAQRVVDDVASSDAGVAHVLEQSSDALDGALDALGEVDGIIHSMLEYVANKDSKKQRMIDLNRAIETTLAMMRNETKRIADVDTDFGDLPLVASYVADFERIVTNLVSSAAEAIAEAVRESGGKGRITVRTRRDGGDVVVVLGHNGKGLGGELERVFEDEGLAVVRNLVARSGMDHPRRERGGPGVCLLPASSDRGTEGEPRFSACGDA